ncbi:zinc metalloprotease HtpX [Candidatus Adlerbacteria bacterium RIFCSPHIGHO2_01_FULL_54_23]|uniref:Protease HtpX homolog n=3 Tax=Candidatus Adleribacteriota TaxID=1752736 RepID=A0A1F4XZM4_9BACT|nr:MAG: Protease HtpX-like protein [Candidatus Adlerbacteria bacterium GW2011_GWA1_54_10]KKW37707.1 MAG: Protease HtpX-like protein [Candidatus Adlerbacteria bacterium GW2011_GWB1_54_7]OGC79528.1 MAG: zinc metalloprotease HtpX [Candidatus Adlerbacteria bacterium RIFCSPHIGHO2_01_FULL_54_23]OGC87175.1 MAG: zinc metalloprotease HtpX [Candidatus Adlerbacteria bacterium RIFCSPLOWO2_01_FULL_54_16]
MASNLYTHQDQNIAKTWLLMAMFALVAIGIGWAVSWYFDSPGVLAVAVIFAAAMNVASYWFSDKIVVAAARARPADERQYADLHNIIENLSITAGLPKPRVYIIEDPAPNAFATGRNAKHAVVAVTTGLLQTLDKNELEGVIAHELSHVGNKDMLVSTVVVVLVGVVTIVSDIFLRTSIFGRGNREERGNPILAVIAIAFVVLAPIVATLLQLAISRKREFLADASGALLTRYPEGLANALRKISGYNAPMLHANTATAHLYISNPFGPRAAAGGLAKLFMTHPPIEERIKALLGQ